MNCADPKLEGAIYSACFDFRGAILNRAFIKVSSSLCNSKRGLYKSEFAVGWESTIWERRLYFQTARESGGQSGQTRGWLVQGERGVNVEAGATVDELRGRCCR